MGAFDIISLGLLSAFFFGALVFYGQTKNSSEENSKQTFENAKSEAKFIVYLTLGVFGVLAAGAMLFGN
jgi:hypothetical protein